MSEIRSCSSFSQASDGCMGSHREEWKLKSSTMIEFGVALIIVPSKQVVCVFVSQFY